MSQEFRLSPELAEKLNKFHPSPDILSQKVYASLDPELSIYEVTCFAIEWLAKVAQTNMSFLEPSVKDLCKVFYFSHYLSVYDTYIRDAVLETQADRSDGHGEISNSATKE